MDQLADEAHLHKVMPLQIVRVSRGNLFIEQGRGGRLEASIIGIPRMIIQKVGHRTILGIQRVSSLCSITALVFERLFIQAQDLLEFLTRWGELRRNLQGFFIHLSSPLLLT
jgi:hypothetical protein